MTEVAQHFPPELYHQPRVVRWARPSDRFLSLGLRLFALILLLTGVGYSVIMIVSSASGLAIENQLLFMIAFLITAAFLVGYLAFIKPWQERRLYERGLPALGVIGHKEIANGGKSGLIYLLHYTFNHLDGQEREEMQVNKTRWGKATVGEKVTVLFYEDRDPCLIYEYGRYVCV